MTWFNVGDRVTWKNHRGITLVGTILYILEPGEVAEDILDEKERTKLSTKNLGARIVPGTRRALINVVDEHGWVTYHTQKLGTLKLKEDEIEPTMKDVMIELRELRELMTSQTNRSVEYRNNGAVVRTIR